MVALPYYRRLSSRKGIFGATDLLYTSTSIGVHRDGIALSPPPDTCRVGKCPLVGGVDTSRRPGVAKWRPLPPSTGGSWLAGLLLPSALKSTPWVHGALTGPMLTGSRSNYTGPRLCSVFGPQGDPVSGSACVGY